MVKNKKHDVEVEEDTGGASFKKCFETAKLEIKHFMNRNVKSTFKSLSSWLLRSSIPGPRFASIFYLSDYNQESGNKIEARGLRNDDGFLVLKGSRIARIASDCIQPDIREKREAEAVDSSGLLEEDVLFNHSSDAAAFVTGRHAIGLEMWKSDKGETLKSIDMRKMKKENRCLWWDSNSNPSKRHEKKEIMVLLLSILYRYDLFSKKYDEDLIITIIYLFLRDMSQKDDAFLNYGNSYFSLRDDDYGEEFLCYNFYQIPLNGLRMKGVIKFDEEERIGPFILSDKKMLLYLSHPMSQLFSEWSKNKTLEDCKLPDDFLEDYLQTEENKTYYTF